MRRKIFFLKVHVRETLLMQKMHYFFFVKEKYVERHSNYVCVFFQFNVIGDDIQSGVIVELFLMKRQK